MSDCASASVRPLKVSDIPAALQLSAEAGWNQTAEDWRRLIDLTPKGCVAIDVDGELAATTTLMCYGQRLAWVGMVLTKLQHRGRGFARRLLTQSLARADGMGILTVKLDATDEGKPIYEKLGFHSEQAVERWSRLGVSGASGLLCNAPCDAPLTEEWHSADRQAFGADRTQLLENLAHRNPPLAVESSYVLTRPGRQTAYLGPCVSDSSETARAVIARALLTGSSSWSWDLLPDNANAVAIARDLGFTPRRHLTRMVRGKDLCTQTEGIYAIAGFELG
jgi:GNAT superfamily N-acetyltransferase